MTMLIQNRRTFSFCLFVLFTAINLITTQTTVAQTRRYAKPGGSGTGTGSWDNASGGLQDMINASAPGDEVWVMKGSYQPAAGVAFIMAAGVKLYGSFAGTEAVLSDRIIGSTSTDSSRLIGNGSNVIVNNQNGLDATALLDGFFITSGRSVKGGGMYNYSSSPTVSHCIFSGNVAAGIQGQINSEIYGGGMYNKNASMTITDCVFSGNNAGSGGLQGVGGGIFNDNASAVITNCIFTGNTARGTAVSYGGGVAASGAIQLINCNFLGNSSGLGGGLYVAPPAASNIINCNFSGNAGAGIYYSGSAPVNIKNCIVWGNTSGIVNNPSFTAIATSNSIVQGGYTGAGNLNINPLFVSQPDYTKAPTISGDLHLQSASPAIDMGSNANVPANVNTDIAGNPRVFNNTVDMGAYEHLGSSGRAGLADANKNVSMVVSANGTSTFLADANGLIASVSGDGTAGAIAGNVTARVWIESGVPVFNGQPYVARHYEITPPVSSALATVALYFTQQDFDNYNNAAGNVQKLPVDAADNEGYKANLRIIKYSLSSSDGTGLMDSYHNGVNTIDPDDAAINWNGNYWVVSFPVSGFSGFFAQTGLNALPVKWISSNAQVNSQGNAVISWKVQEQNVAAYEIQKSGDGISFTKSGMVNSAGDGENSYRFMEAGIFTGSAFYRIQQTDKDGKTAYSSILQLQSSTAAKATVSVYPNPVHEMTVLSISSLLPEKIICQLTDNRGIVLQQKIINVNAGTSNIPFSTDRYPAGLYYLKLQGATINRRIRLVKL